MPLDATTYLDTSPGAALARFRETPTLADLAVILRHREVWPGGFRWAFWQCETCAMGLSAAMLDADPNAQEQDYFGWVEQVFGIDPLTSARLFDLPSVNGPDRLLVTPEQIASAIERHLAAR